MAFILTDKSAIQVFVHRMCSALFLQDPRRGQRNAAKEVPRVHTWAVLDELRGGGGPHQNEIMQATAQRSGWCWEQHCVALIWSLSVKYIRL